jgi:VanZ family protein
LLQTIATLRKKEPKILNRRYKFFIYWFPVLLYCVLIFIQSSYPAPKIGPNWPNFDKVLHFLGYALLGALLLRAFDTTSISHRLNLIFVLSVLLSGLYGVSDEFHQSFVPYRDASAMDALADFLGGAFGAGVFFLWVKSHLKKHT